MDQCTIGAGPLAALADLRAFGARAPREMRDGLAANGRFGEALAAQPRRGAASSDLFCPRICASALQGRPPDALDGI
ncbi:protein of unknown function (plasmid) [Methylocella tundrae]|uniref:Uncharacterized protein n=1 Tax=Methylocella tundrae TaxID=227605 RepID=A0A4V6INA1_METTU|nr:protein of unknown function [Methylocella tundrae]